MRVKISTENHLPTCIRNDKVVIRPTESCDETVSPLINFVERVFGLFWLEIPVLVTTPGNGVSSLNFASIEKPFARILS